MTPHPLLKPLQEQDGQHGQHGGWTLEVEEARADSVGIRAGTMHLHRDAPAECDAIALAIELAGRATYLLEPLQLLEGSGAQALLRSELTPTEAGQTYYELWLTPQSLALTRYRAVRGQPREPLPFTLTWEQAERLVRDIEAAYARPCGEAAER